MSGDGAALAPNALCFGFNVMSAGFLFKATALLNATALI